MKLVFKKKRPHKTFKTMGSPIDYNLFSYLRNCCKQLSKINYSHYLNSIQNSITHNPKKIWSYIKSKKTKKCPAVCT